MIILDKIMFNHTDFYKANKSSVLREFIFFAQITAYDSLYIDVFQSSELDLTDMIWLYKVSPRINIVESEVKIVKNPLKTTREVEVKN